MTSASFSRSVWDVDAADFPSTVDTEAKATFLLRYAILAPSSYNSQPWRFRVDGNAIDIAVDESRWLETADPDKRELHISVGCALENLRVAAEHFGFDPQVGYHKSSDAGSVATVRLLEDSEPSSSRPPALFEALTARRTSHEPFENRPLDEARSERLRAVVSEADVSLTLVEDSETKASISELQAEADRLLMDDPDYRRELGHWIGLGALGNSWLMARIGQAVAHISTSVTVRRRRTLRSSTVRPSSGSSRQPPTTRWHISGRDRSSSGWHSRQALPTSRSTR